MKLTALMACVVLAIGTTTVHAEGDGIDPDSAMEQAVAIGLAYMMCDVDLRGSQRDMDKMQRDARHEMRLNENDFIEFLSFRVREDEALHRAQKTDRAFCREMRRLAGR